MVPSRKNGEAAAAAAKGERKRSEGEGGEGEGDGGTGGVHGGALPGREQLQQCACGLPV